MQKNSNAVVFHYFEANQTYKDNLIYFLSTGYSEELDFYIVIADKCTIELPNLANIKYFYCENINNDYGGYSQLINNTSELREYNKVLFINSSTRGPFFPSYLSKWWEAFFGELKENTHLVGATINILPPEGPIHQKAQDSFGPKSNFSHVQTTSYALSGEALRLLIDSGFYKIDHPLSKDDVIVQYEIGLSHFILSKHWNIKCLQSIYNTINYHISHHDINFTSNHGDPLSQEAYFKRTLHPQEVIFIKTNRDLLSSRELHSHTYSELTARTHTALSEWNESISLKKSSLSELQVIEKKFKRKIKKISSKW